MAMLKQYYETKVKEIFKLINKLLTKPLRFALSKKTKL